jgi:hypothetical protein
MSIRGTLIDMKAENPLSVSSPFLAAPALPTKIGALALPLLFALAACGGSNASTPPPETPATASQTNNESAPAEKPVSPDNPAPSLAAQTAAPASEPAKIDFPPHATVEQAIKAIPQGQPRVNMSDDALRAPLLDLKRYDKCKIPRSTKVSMTIAVYDGAAVGADITSKPKNAKIEECVDSVVRSMTWNKVPSLNTVNVHF